MNRLTSIRPLTSLIRRTRAWAVSVASRHCPVLLARFRYREQKGNWPRLEMPQTFDEKLLWLMLYWRHPLKSICGDKYAMRAYVSEMGLEHVLSEFHGVYCSSDQIEFDSLPNRFVLKCTHGCRMNIICKDKNMLDIHETLSTLDKWMKTDYSTIAGELHYSSMTPRIICERFLGDDKGNLPNDYKLYCFHGLTFCTLVCSQRDGSGHAKSDFYDRPWNARLPYSRANPIANVGIERPENYLEMVEIAENLSAPFPFVRVDFFCVNGKTIISEMTFTPSACVDVDYPDAAQLELGEKIHLPRKMIL